MQSILWLNSPMKNYIIYKCRVGTQNPNFRVQSADHYTMGPQNPNFKKDRSVCKAHILYDETMRIRNTKF